MEDWSVDWRVDLTDSWAPSALSSKCNLGSILFLCISIHFFAGETFSSLLFPLFILSFHSFMSHSYPWHVPLCFDSLVKEWLWEDFSQSISLCVSPIHSPTSSLRLLFMLSFRLLLHHRLDRKDHALYVERVPGNRIERIETGNVSRGRKVCWLKNLSRVINQCFSLILGSCRSYLIPAFFFMQLPFPDVLSPPSHHRPIHSWEEKK